MRSAQKQFYYPPAPINGQQNVAFFPPLHSSPFHPQLYSGVAPQVHTTANGLQVLGVPIGGFPPQFPTAAQVLPLQNGVLPPLQQWGHIHGDGQNWGGAGVFSAHGSPQPFHQQFQQAHQSPPFMRPSGGPANGGVQINSFGRDVLPKNNQRSQSHQRNGEFGAKSMQRNSRQVSDGSQSTDLSSPGSCSNKRPFGGPSSSRFSGGRNRDHRDDSSRSQPVSLRCDPCERTFNNAQQHAAHNSTHVKCDAEGCSFEASGRVVKEHKQSMHEKHVPEPLQTRTNWKQRESEEEVHKWREERKRNYPTTGNIQRKAEEIKARKARGELVDEDAKKRRERLKEILARQAELGCPIAEVPAYYMSAQYGLLPGGKGGNNTLSSTKDGSQGGKRRRNDRSNHLVESVKDRQHQSAKIARVETVPQLINSTVDDEDSVTLISSGDGNFYQNGAQDCSTAMDTHSNEKAPVDKVMEKICYFFKRGRCKKGNRCEFLHERKPKKERASVPATQLTTKRVTSLLTKLLDSDIRRDKSHLLQCFRFFVNNDFLLEWPQQQLKFFNWTELEDTKNNEVSRPDGETAALLALEPDQLLIKSLGDLVTRQGNQDYEEGHTDSDGDGQCSGKSLQQEESEEDPAGKTADSSGQCEEPVLSDG